MVAEPIDPPFFARDRSRDDGARQNLAENQKIGQNEPVAGSSSQCRPFSASAAGRTAPAASAVRTMDSRSWSATAARASKRSKRQGEPLRRVGTDGRAALGRLASAVFAPGVLRVAFALGLGPWGHGAPPRPRSAPALWVPLSRGRQAARSLGRRRFGAPRRPFAVARKIRWKLLKRHETDPEMARLAAPGAGVLVEARTSRGRGFQTKCSPQGKRELSRPPPP